jgi:hypothetical protein
MAKLVLDLRVSTHRHAEQGLGLQYAAVTADPADQAEAGLGSDGVPVER